MLVQPGCGNLPVYLHELSGNLNVTICEHCGKENIIHKYIGKEVSLGVITGRSYDIYTQICGWCGKNIFWKVEVNV